MFSSTKLASIFILFGLSVISGIGSCLTVTCLAHRYSTAFFHRAISILNCFSGGVFLATSILHLLPESRESLEDVLSELGNDLEYPFTELLMGVGFLMMLLLEHAAHACCSSTESHGRHRECSESSVTYSKINGTSSPSKAGTNIRVDETFEDSSCFDDMTYQTYGTVDGSVDDTVARPYRDLVTPTDMSATDIKFDGSERIVIKKHNSAATQQGAEHITTKAALQELPVSADGSVSKLRGVVLLVALSLHMVFDGLALGLLKTDSKVWELVLALSLHKVLVFFTIALQAFEILKAWKKTILLVCVLALISPMGIVIGDSLNSDNDDVAKDVVSAVLQGIATGTFLFVTFFEILLRELTVEDHDIVKVVSVVLGFAIVAGVKFTENE